MCTKEQENGLNKRYTNIMLQIDYLNMLPLAKYYKYHSLRVENSGILVYSLYIVLSQYI